MISLLDPTTYIIMIDPVIASDNITYERNNIQYIINTSKISPYSKEILKDQVVINYNLRKKINNIIIKYIKLLNSTQ